MPDSQRDEIDLILDRALRSYGQAMPLAGLEQRVHNRISLVNARRRTLKVGYWALASFVVLTIELWHPAEPLRPVRQSSLESRLKPELAAPKKMPTHFPIRFKAKAKTKPFPALTPLTGEERALVALVQSQPPKVLRFSESLDIEPIEIQLLEEVR